MAISRYPHFGYPIAPIRLAPMLRVPTPVNLAPRLLMRYPHLADLDSSVWTWLNSREIAACADAVVLCIAKQKSSHFFHQIRFPSIPAFVTPDVLELQVRTFNCLNSALSSRVISSLSDLQKLTANELLTTLKAFGVRSLVDLLVSLERLCDECGQNVRAQGTPPSEITVPGMGEIKQELGYSPNTGPLTFAEVANLLENPSKLSLGSIKTRYFPSVPPAVRFEDLRLSARSQHCLNTMRRQGVIRSPIDLSSMRLHEVLRRKDFGRKSLIDLLGALSSYAPPRAFSVCSPEVSPLSSALTKSAERLRAVRYAGAIRCNDLRLGRYLKPIWAYSNAAHSDTPLASAAHLYAVAHRLVGREHDINPEELLAVIQNTRTAMSAAMRLTLDRELFQLVTSVTSTRRAGMFVQYYGWDGSGVSTLQSVGDRHGITRERVRQIVSPIAKLLRRAKPFTPILDRTLLALSKHVPMTEAAAEEVLRKRGLVSRAFRLDGVLSAAELLGKSATFVLDEPADTQSPIRSDQIGFAKTVTKAARSAVSRFGVSTLADVCSRCNDLTGSAVNPQVVSQLLPKQVAFHWLDEESTWFWIDNLSRNHLVRLIRKVLAVAPRIHVSEVRAAISADPRGMGYAPPPKVVMEFCKQACDCTADSQFVVCESPPDPISTLSKAEMIQYDVLTECGPLLLRYDFERECCTRGMNPHTYSMYLGRSPIVARYATSVYGLRGANIAPGEIERVAPQRPSTSLVRDYGWSADAKPWILCELSASIISSGVFSVPASMRNLLEGRFVFCAEDQSRLGTLVITKHDCWGLAPLFTRRGGEPGDSLLLSFDLRTHEVTAHMGADRDLLEEGLTT